MAAMNARRGIRRLMMTALGGALVAVTLTSCGSSGSDPATEPAADGWKTIEHQGVRVDVPAGWTRADTESCEFQFERWTPPGLPACGADGGVAFYGSATFDPAHGPGTRHDTTNGAAAWAGYVFAGDFAVYVADDDRTVVERVLRSARADGE